MRIFLEMNSIWPHKWAMNRSLLNMFCLLLLLAAPASASAQDESEGLTLVNAVMCEKIVDSQPVNETVVFSISADKAVCFTYFNPVPESTHIFHRWFRRDRLSARIKLQVRPPRWSTFSRIQFRDGDKGPWRVEVTDAEGKLLTTLRFSITE
jgi:hypothetical protein